MDGRTKKEAGTIRDSVELCEQTNSDAEIKICRSFCDVFCVGTAGAWRSEPELLLATQQLPVPQQLRGPQHSGVLAFCLPRSSGPLRDAAACDTISTALNKMASKPFTKLTVGGSIVNVKFPTALPWRRLRMGYIPTSHLGGPNLTYAERHLRMTKRVVFVIILGGRAVPVPTICL